MPGCQLPNLRAQKASPLRLGVRSVAEIANGSSIPPTRPANVVQAPLYSGPSPTFGWPNMPKGMCFSPASSVLLVPSLILARFVLLEYGGRLLAPVFPRMMTPLAVTENQFGAVVLPFKSP